MKDGFTPRELTLDYHEWTKLVEQTRDELTSATRQWLAEWELWDLACSPMRDDERRFIRYGHALGWTSRG